MTLVIGYGNPLRGDDGIGQYVAQQLAGRIRREDVEILARLQLTPELVEPVSRAGFVIFVDACEGEPAGQVRVIAVEPEAATGAFTHNVTPSSLLAGARALYGAQSQGVVVSVSSTHFGYDETLSPAAAMAIPEVMQEIERRIERQTVVPEEG